jgi:arginase
MFSNLSKRAFTHFPRNPLIKYSCSHFSHHNNAPHNPRDYYLPNYPLPAPLHRSVPFSQFIAEPRTVAILGAPLADGQPLAGVDLGPKYLRSAGLIERLARDNWAVEDLGDLKFPTKLQGKEDNRVRSNLIVAKANEMIYETILPHAKANKFCLTLGGDHSIAIGSISSILTAAPHTGIIWVDAHADINTPQASASGNIHGMVAAFLMNLHHARSIYGFEWMKSVPLLDPRYITYIGLRDVDQPERNILKQLGIRAFSMYDVDRYGIAKVMEMALDHLIGRVPRPIHLSFDIDSIDPAFAPSTGTRVMGGLNYREAYYICEATAETNCLSSMDLVEVNPSLSSPEGSDMTTGMAVGLCSSALGNKIL